ncbi:MAG: efflux RND transporter periplasmic adaptor subunit [Alphaproteobacteria bacterium]|nr:efflux RND transporter periplasmic adaptor subunit [Alphaproteobacteria bacterium]
MPWIPPICCRRSSSGTRRGWTSRQVAAQDCAAGFVKRIVMARTRSVILWMAAPAVVAAAAYGLWLGDRHAPPPAYRLAKVESGTIVATVSATGTVQPVTTVLVGSQLSGQVRELLADFNTAVKAGQVIARLDDDQIKARLAATRAELAQARAGLLTARAQVERMRAELALATANVANGEAQIRRAESQFAEAERERDRKRALVARGAATVADTDRAEAAVLQAQAGLASIRAQADGVRASLIAAEAGLRVSDTQVAAADAQVAQREAAVRQVEVDLDRAEIKAPIDGVVIRRDVDVGQTVAASLTAPTLFTIAQDLRQVEIHVAVDEADVGRVRPGHEAQFTVNAYPASTFSGEVLMTRLGAQTVQNVVTYVVVINAENREQRLLPGMTTTVRVITDRRDGAVKVPNAALRWRPPGAPRNAEAAAPAAGGASPGGWVGLDQLQPVLTKELGLDGEQQAAVAAVVEEARGQFRALRSAGLQPEQLRARMRASRQQVETRIAAVLRPEQQKSFEAWRAQRASGTAAAVQGRVYVVGDDGAPRAVPVRLGIGDGSFTEIVGGDVRPGQELIVGGGPRPAAAVGAPAGGPRAMF